MEGVKPSVAHVHVHHLNLCECVCVTLQPMVCACEKLDNITVFHGLVKQGGSGITS